MPPQSGSIFDGVSQPDAATARGGAVAWTIRLVALVALGSSGYLTWEAFSSGASEMFGCGFSPLLDCHHVLNSQWAKWFGLPVSLGGLGVYVSILAVTLLLRPAVSRDLRRFGWAALLALSMAAAGSAVWFIYVQTFLVQSLCPWCMVVHVCGLAVATCVVGFGPVTFKRGRSGESIDIVKDSLNPERTTQPPSGAHRPLVTAPATAILLAVGLSTTLILIAGQQSTRESTMIVEMAEAPKDIEEVVNESTDGEANRAVDDNTAVDDGELPPSETESPPAVPPAEATNDPAESALLLDETQLPEFPSDSSPSPEEPRTDTAAASVISESPQSGEETGEPSTTITLKTTPPDVDPDLDNDPVDSPSSTPSEQESTVEPSSTPSATAPSAPVESPPATAPLEPLRWERKLSIYNGRDELDLDDHIVSGKIGAPFVIVTIFDYTCSHCRQMHTVMQTLRRRYGDQLAIVHVPAPLNVSCNPYVTRTAAEHRDACYLTRLSLAVWRVRPSAFAEYDDWLFQSRRSRTEARARAVQLIGGDRLSAVLSDPWLARQLRRCVEIHNASGSTGLPVTLVGRRTAKGNEASARDTTATLSRVMEAELGITPVGGAAPVK